MAISPTTLSHLNPFRTETLAFGKIAWISSPKVHDFKIALMPMEPPPAAPILNASSDLTFVPYEFKLHAASRFAQFSRPKHINFLKLIHAVDAVKAATHYDAYEDYQTASTHLRETFSYAMNETVKPVNEMIAMTSSSAEPSTKPALVDDSGRVLGALPVDDVKPMTAANAVDTKSYEEQAALADLELSKDPLVQATENMSRGHGSPEPVGKTFAATRENEDESNENTSPNEVATTNEKTTNEKTTNEKTTNEKTVNEADLDVSTTRTESPALANVKHAQNHNVDFVPNDNPSDEVPLVTVDSQNAGVMAALLNSQKLNNQHTQAEVVSPSIAASNAPIVTSNPLPNPLTKTARAHPSVMVSPAPVVHASFENINNNAMASVTLSSHEQKDLSDALLNTQLAAAGDKQSDLEGNTTRQKNTSLTANSKFSPTVVDDEELSPHEEMGGVVKPVSIPETNPNISTSACKSVATQQFIKAGGSAATDVAIQVCPTNLTWLSRSQDSSAWLKVEGDDYFPTLTLEPAPNNGSTLLLDHNALGVLSIKSGVHVTKGMGIILGPVPDGYKVNFTGRAEETEYFDSTGHTYFVILNAEPGAGVVEVESKANPNISSTVFAPVLGDVITYLDLAAPIARNLKIKIVKSGKANDPEVSKLTVGLSTQTGLQAITRADGQATLKNVNLVPGFPVFIDVASRNGGTESFTYRYQIKHPESGNVFVAPEVNDQSIHHWLSQVKQGLSDQSAMVIGIYDRKKLNGFKSIHYSQVEALTAKYGLEPMSYSVLWNGEISSTEPLEGDLPRFMSVQVPEGLSNVKLLNETREVESSELFPISPRVIHMIAN